MAFGTFVLSPARLHLQEAEVCILMIRPTTFHLNPTIRETDDKDTKGIDSDMTYSLSKNKILISLFLYLLGSTVLVQYYREFNILNFYSVLVFDLNFLLVKEKISKYSDRGSIVA